MVLVELGRQNRDVAVEVRIAKKGHQAAAIEIGNFVKATKLIKRRVKIDQ